MSISFANLNKNFILYLYKNISIKFTYIIYGLVRVLISHKKIKRSLKIKTSFLAQKERFESYAFAASDLYILAPLLRKPSQTD